MPEQVQQPTSLPQDTSQKTSWKKIIFTVLIILVVTGLIAGAYWFFVLNKNSETSDLTGPVPKPVVPTATPSATPSVEKEETADWKTHTDKVLGFQVKYPNDWFVDSAVSWTEETQYNGGSNTDITNFDKNKITNPGELKVGQYKITIVKQTKEPSQSLKDFALSKRSSGGAPLIYLDLETDELGDFIVYKNVSSYEGDEEKGISTVTIYLGADNSTVYGITGFFARGQYESDLNLIVSSFRLL